MKKIVLTIASLITLSAAQAQVRFGPEVGLNLSSVNSKATNPLTNAVDRQTSDMKVGFRIGGVADIALTSHLYLRPGVFFSQMGGKEDILGSDFKATYNYIQVPVNVLYKLGTDGGGRFYFGLLPYVGFAIGGKYELASQEVDVEVGDDVAKDDLKALDLGIGIKAGYELPFGMYFDASFMQGVANTAPGGNSDNKNNNRLITIGIGYLFGGK